MSKNIILLSDGTGNGAAKLFRTNVWRVYEALDLTDPKDPKDPRQFAFYDNGVGTSSFRPLAILGGALGFGLARNVRDLYAFVCRTYSPRDENGLPDKIYAFGFSRGAFTIRVLVGLILNQGLVPYDGNEAELDRLCAAAYRQFRKERFKTVNPLVRGARAVRDWVIDAWCQLWKRKPYSEIIPKMIGRPGSDRPIEVEFVGLWDTVDAYGLPVDELTRAVDLFVWPLTMRDYNLSRRVKRARHALALDDERNTFHPRLWNEEPDPDDPDIGVPGGNRATTHIDEERVTQVWFAGVHANVGGGYPDDSLAHVSLGWIMNEADKYGLRFSQDIRKDQRALADENGPIYDSRHGLAGYYRYNPRRIEKLTDPDQAGVKRTDPHKVEVKRTKVHESVFRRIQLGQDGYAPIVLPPGFAVAGIDGTIADGAASLRELAERSQAAEGQSVVRRDAEIPQAGDGRNAPRAEDLNMERLFRDREHVWNWVWWRRVAYFFTLFTTFVLALMPLIWPALPRGACASPWCFVSNGVDAAAAVLPGFAATWTDAFASNPGIFLTLAGLIGAGLFAGGVLERRIRDEMRPVWYAVPGLKPRAERFPAPSQPGPVNRFVRWLRTRPSYQKAFWLLTHRALPGVFLFALFYAAVAVMSQVTFAARASRGQVCAPAGVVERVSAGEKTAGFRPDALCHSAGLFLEKGATYRLRIAVPAHEPWTDRGIPAGPNGVGPQNTSLPMTAAVPLRRHIAQPWFKPMARIGEKGTDVYPLDPKPSLSPNAVSPEEEMESGGPGFWASVRRLINACVAPASVKPAPAPVTFETELVARSDGELFLYVNDAVLSFPMFPTSTCFYRNNTGTAHVTMKRLLQAGD